MIFCLESHSLGPLFWGSPSAPMSYETLILVSRALSLPNVFLQLSYCPLTLNTTLLSLGRAIM